MPCVQALPALALALALAAPGPASAAHGFLRKSDEVTTAEAQSSLLDELTGNVSSGRLQELEEALRPMYSALPKGENGYLGHQAVRYALHRLLLQRHGWFIVGLEPTDKALPPYLHADWVPEYLQGLLEQRLGDHGLSLREMAALAAAMEDLVHAEDGRRLDSVLGLLRMPLESRLSSGEADRVLETYMMMYLDGDSVMTDKDMGQELALFKQEYADWESAAAWMQEIKGHHASSSSDSKLGRSEMVSVAKELGDRFGAFNDGECHSLKGAMRELEGSRPGRVPLLDFYKRGLYSHWQFNEKVDYLRVLGALDESDPVHPSVIMANYLGSRTNCLTPSRLYAVCCRNECEDLMGHLERRLAASAATPEQILALVTELPSDTVNASRTLSEGLVYRLRSIADRHGGQVPLHGRLFAQWMHHVYPRECPYPHEGGANPQTPDEWLREAGEAGKDMTEEDIRKLLGDCAGNETGGAPCRPRASGGLRTKAPASELPWTDGEVLLAKGPARSGDGLEGPTSRVLMAKTVILLVLFVIMTLHKSGAVGGRRNKKRMARNLDFADFDDFEDLKKPLKRMQQWQRWLVLLGLLAVCIVLEAIGVLDRFSFACFLFVGLLLNVALPLAMQRGPFRGPKPLKYCE